MTDTCVWMDLRASEAHMRAIRAAGFAGVDVSLTDVSALLAPDWRSAAENCARRLAACGLRANQTHLPYYDLRVTSSRLDPDMDEAALRAVEATALLGAPWTAYHARSSIEDGYDAAASMRYAREALSPLIEAAARFGTGIAIENLPVFPDLPQMRFYTSDWEEHIELVDSFADARVGACWDFGHAHLMPYDHARVLKKLGRRVKITHIHDNDRLRDRHLPPYMGDADWPRLMRALREAGYAGALSLEVTTRELPESMRDACVALCGEAAKLLRAEYEA